VKSDEDTMRFALLYYYDPTKTGPAKGEVSDWLAFDQQVKDAGVFDYEVGFQPQNRARTVSVRDGRATVEDGGPMGTAGEILAGCYVLDVEGAEQAKEWARKIPTATYGKVEVRPIVEFPSSTRRSS
jgi:hypothetical protein